jgi:Tfp pilus assembly protein PilF
VDAFAWTVVGSVAGVVGAAATVFGLFPLLAARRREKAAAQPGIVLARAGVAPFGSVPPGSPAERAPAAASDGGDTLPARNPVFTGRDGALRELAGKLEAGPVAVVAVRGLGGVGKSQLALEYAYQERESGRYQVAGWVRADSPVTVAEDLAALGPLLRLPAEGTMGERAEQVVSALRAQRDWLMVFDNAHRPGDLQGWLPGGAGHVLITSRDRAWSGTADQVDLDTFTRAESVEFLCHRSGCADEAAAGELADAVGDLPLALAQAAAYIDSRSMKSIGRYLALYQDPALAARLRDAGLDSAEYPASVATTWLLSFTQLASERPAAVELLRLCAYLDPDDIDLDLLTAGKDYTGEWLDRALADPLDRAETAGALAAASLITIPAAGHLRIHRLVQAVTRDQLDHDQATTWTGRALTLIAAVFPDDPSDHRTWPACAIAAPHAQAVTGHAASSPALARQAAALLGSLGIYLTVSAQLKSARATQQRALAIKEAAYGPDHPEVAATLTNLGIVQRELGDLADARATQQRALAIFEAAYGPDHPEAAITLTNLGNVQRELGELDDARATYQRALVSKETAYGPDHPQVAITLTNLGIAQEKLGELADARAILQRALAINEAAYGPDHPEAAITLTNLGIVQLELGDLADARATLQRALAIKETVYDRDHPQVAITLGNLGNVQQKLGDLADARATQQRALAIFQATYGPGHPDVARTLGNLRSIQQQMRTQ